MIQMKNTTNIASHSQLVTYWQRNFDALVVLIQLGLIYVPPNSTSPISMIKSLMDQTIPKLDCLVGILSLMSTISLFNTSLQSKTV